MSARPAAQVPENLLSEDDMIEHFGLRDRRELHDLRNANDWPAIRISRTKFRWTREMVEQIERMHTERPETDRPLVIPGQTKRSAARSR